MTNIELEESAPSTIKEVGIHLAYLRKDMSDMKKLIEELPNGFATKENLLGLENRVRVLEDEHGSFWVRFGIPTSTAVSGAVLVILLLSFLDRLK